jgi:Mlc titration factor MtfA (ptsG expression regulator)
MEGWFILIALLFGLPLLVFLIMRYRLRRALAQAFPPAYLKIIRKHIPAYVHMPTALQMQLKHHIKQFLHQKNFVGCAGLIVSDEMRIVIAAKACLLLLNRPSAVYGKLTHILIYPSAFLVPQKQHDSNGLIIEHTDTLAGQSWGDGRVLLAWDEILKNRHQIEEGHDVVLHEFAHQLDSEDGVHDGTPVLGQRAAYAEWKLIMQNEFDYLRHSAEHGEATLIDPYGAQNPAEFFAVVTEAFFMRSTELAQFHPALYQQLHKYYRVDPREWLKL